MTNERPPREITKRPDGYWTTKDGLPLIPGDSVFYVDEDGRKWAGAVHASDLPEGYCVPPLAPVPRYV